MVFTWQMALSALSLSLLMISIRKLEISCVMYVSLGVCSFRVIDISQMLQKDVESRPLYEAMLNHPFFASMYEPILIIRSLC